MPGTLSFHDFSWRGDRKWSGATKWTVYAPIVVCWIFFFAVVQIACGSIWIVQLGSNFTAAMIVQTLLIPGCSFFNAIPSLHLHMLLRNNPPKLAMWFSSIFVLVYLASTILMLAACSGGPGGIPHGLRVNECPRTTSGAAHQAVQKGVWDTMIVFQFFSIIAYATHGIMAWKVNSVLKGREKRGEVEAVDPDEVEAKRQKARELWAKNYRMEGL